MKLKRRKLCKCGCGRYIRFGNRFINGHNKGHLGYTHNNETKRKISRINKGRPSPKRGIPLSDGQKEKISKTLIGYKHTKEARKNMSLASKGKPKSEEHKNKLRNKVLSEEHRKKISQFRKGFKHDEEFRLMRSKMCTEQWKSQKFVDKQMKSRRISPNKPESILLGLLNKLYPDEWKYTGDLSFMIDGKCPDFTNVNGQKKLIELFGDYWHRGQNPQDRIDVFKPFGWNTLVIWESELKEIENVEYKIISFVEEF